MSEPAAVVVCPQPEAAETGALVLEAGGNAIDAAVAVAFSQMVIDPPMAGLGGYGVMLFREASTGRVTAVDFSAHAGAAVRPDQWLAGAGDAQPDRFGYAVDGLLNDIGYQSVGVPGIVEGLGAAHERWGSLEWGALLEPAIDAARDGVAVSKAVHDFWLEPPLPGRASGFERMTATPAAASIFAPDGDLLEVGEKMVQPELAATLEAIADRGYRDFYEGRIADLIAADFAANGGHLTRDDLSRYRAGFLDPLRVGYRDWSVYGAPPPAGGQVVAQMLGLLERFDLAGIGPGGARSIALLVEAMKYGIRGRMTLGPHPEIGAVETLLQQDHLEPFFSLVSSGGQIEAEPLPAYEPATTTQATVVDHEENIVSLTHSLGYGSGVVTPGLGFLFNNYMNVFNPYPGHPDSLRPGGRRTSSMAPTIVTGHDDRPVAALGAPGATRITSAVLQSLVNHLDHAMTPVEAVSAPRVDCQGSIVEIENRISRSTEATLAESGYAVHRREQNYDPYFARAQMVGLVSGAWEGASDPRRDGGAPVHARGRSRG